MLNFTLHFYFQAILKRLSRLTGSSVRGLGYSRLAARQLGRGAGVQPGGQPIRIAWTRARGPRSWGSRSPKPRHEITEITVAVAILLLEYYMVGFYIFYHIHILGLYFVCNYS